MYYLRSWLILIGLISLCSALSLGASELVVTEDTSLASAHAGESVVFRYVVKNTGDTAISGVSLNDSLLGPVLLNRTLLSPGSSAKGAKEYVLPRNGLIEPIRSTAIAKGKDLGGNVIIASGKIAVALSFSSGLSLDIKTSKEFAAFEDTVAYSYSVKNIGDITVNHIALMDDLLGKIALNNTDLTPGSTAAGTKSLSVSRETMPGILLNNATVVGRCAAGYTVLSYANSSLSILPADDKGVADT